MKKLLAILSLVTVFNFSAKADITNWEYFEPTVFCLGGGTAMYMTAPQSQRMSYAAGACAVGALTGYLINSYYKNKYSDIKDQKIMELERTLKTIEEFQANKIAVGEEVDFSYVSTEVVPAQQSSDGSVTAPTLRKKLVLPSKDLMIGR